MIPELNALCEKEIFTKTQVKGIIRKRRQIEYALAAKKVNLETFKKAIKY